MGHKEVLNLMSVKISPGNTLSLIETDAVCSFFRLTDNPAALFGVCFMDKESGDLETSDDLPNMLQ